MTVHALSQLEASAICDDLHDRHGIDVAVRIIDRVAHITPTADCGTWEEVTALAAFLAVTDSAQWHRAMTR